MNISFYDDKPNLDELDIKSDLLNSLKKIKIDELLNLVVYGLPAVGKSIKIYAFLASILDKRVYDLKTMIFEEDRKIVTYKSSIYHIELDPINLGSNEKFFMQNFLKQYIETKNIGLNLPKIILIKNAHLLSKQTQLSLRKSIECTFLTAKFIFEVSNLSNFSQTLISRCTLIRVPMPKIEEIKLCLINYSKRKKHNIEEDIIDQIIEESNKVDSSTNLKKIFGHYRYYIATKKKFKFLYYNKFDEILDFINKKISFVTFQKIRDIVNEIYISLVPMKELLLYIFYNLLKENKNDIEKIIDITVKCDINLSNGNKDCLHLESYIISIIDMIHN